VIALDTNVLLRLFILDDAQQCAAARRFVAENAAHGILVPMLVLAEFVRVYRRKLGRSRSDAAELIGRILEAPEFTVERRGEVEDALGVYRAVPVDFSDCLIVSTARRAGADAVYTFDAEAAKRVPGAILLTT